MSGVRAVPNDAKQPSPHISIVRCGLLHVERVLWTVGLLLLVVILFTLAQIFLAHRSASRIASESAAVSRSEDSSANSLPAGAETNSPAVVGKVEIPALGLATPLLAGDDSMSLTQGAGHIPGTAFPGGLGTVGIAGHRDTHFRLLSRVAKGMDVRLTDHTGTYHYRVTSTEIVAPDDVSVLDILTEPGLALVTCYPFGYVGHAPKRFIVHATLLSAAPDELR